MTDSETIIFYSWQSEHTKTKFHIENALKKAIKELSTTPGLQLTPPRFDKDTQGKVGSVNIPNTIRQKINAATVFIADVSIVDIGTRKNQDGETRDLVNQNVMYELGYATGKLGDESIVLVMNLDLGNEKKLPFDIAQNRVLGFSLKKDRSGNKLVNDLKYVLELHLKYVAETRNTSTSIVLKEQLFVAIDTGKPTKRIAEKYFHDLFSRYDKLYPGENDSTTTFNDYSAHTLDAYNATIELSEEFLDILETITEYRNSDALLACYKKLELLSRQFDLVSNGHPLNPSRDYYTLVVHELISILLGTIAEEKWWDILPELKNIKLKRASKYDDPISMRELYHYPQNALNYYEEMKDVNYRHPAAMLVKTHFINHTNILNTYVDGNFLFWAITGRPALVAMLAVQEYADYTISYIHEFKKRSFISILSKMSPYNIAEYRELLWESAQESQTGWSEDRILQIFLREGIKNKDDLGAE